MSFSKQKRSGFVEIIRKASLFIFTIHFLMAVPAGCQLINPEKHKDQPGKVNKKIDKKHSEKSSEAREALREKHYERQAESTKKRMDHNARQSKEWRRKHMKNDKPSVFKRIINWIKGLRNHFDKPEKGLFGDDPH